MGTGYRGTFVISWSQTEVDGLKTAPMSSLVTGAVWSWQGDALRVDGPSDILPLDGADGTAELHERAARKVKQLVGHALKAPEAEAGPAFDAPLLHTGFVVTDGRTLFTVTLIATRPNTPPLLMFVNDIPPQSTDLWVVDTEIEYQRDLADDTPAAGVICFTPGTRIDTPSGQRRIEDLRPGDEVSTRDNGAQPILWTGSRRLSGARLFVMPRLRPVRIHRSALGEDQPDEDLVVSPDHQILITGQRAYDLFNEREVLVAAKHLVNESSITIDTTRRHVTYVHVLLPQHEVLTANGVPSESFHPAHADLDALSPEDLSNLLAQFPDLDIDPERYGEPARRVLTPSEGVIVGHVA